MITGTTAVRAYFCADDVNALRTEAASNWGLTTEMTCWTFPAISGLKVFSHQEVIICETPCYRAVVDAFVQVCKEDNFIAFFFLL